jgi:hypothetical protein
VPIVLISGSLNLLEPSGPVQACNGIAVPLPLSSILKAVVLGPQPDDGPCRGDEDPLIARETVYRSQKLRSVNITKYLTVYTREDLKHAWTTVEGIRRKSIREETAQPRDHY